MFSIHVFNNVGKEVSYVRFLYKVLCRAGGKPGHGHFKQPKLLFSCIIPKGQQLFPSSGHKIELSMVCMVAWRNETWLNSDKALYCWD